jgi:membrane protease YdiL (CAAX protease family)
VYLDEIDSSVDPPSAVDPAVPNPPQLLNQQREGLKTRIRAFGEVVLCSDFPTQLMLIQLLAWIGLRPLLSDGRLSLLYIATLSLVDAAVLITLILWFLRYHGESARSIFLGGRSIGREVRLGALLVPGLVLFVLLTLTFIQNFAPWLHNVEENPLESLLQTPRDAIIFGLVAIVAGGVREELQRAFILHRFKEHLGGAPVGLVVFSVVFGAGHLIQGWDAALVTTMLGVVWGVVFLSRRSVIAPIVSHAGFNVLEIVRHLSQ